MFYDYVLAYGAYFLLYCTMEDLLSDEESDVTITTNSEVLQLCK